MTKKEADKLLIERFGQLNEAAAQIESDVDNMELCALCDSIHKMFITLCNAGAFTEDLSQTDSGSFKS